MRHFFFKFFLLTTFYLLLTASDCGGGGFGGDDDPPSPSSADLVGTWMSDYFENNGLDATSLYQMTLEFDYQGTCTQILTKPTGLTLSATLPFSMNADGDELTIGSAVFSIEKFDLGYELILVYRSGQQPAGFVQPWRARFKLQ